MEVAVWRAAIWMCVPLVCLAAGWAMTRRRGRSRGAIALGIIVAALTVAGLAADVSWRLTSVNGRRPDASQVRLVEALSRAPASATAIVFRDAPRNDGFGRAERTTKRVTHDDLSARLSFSTTFRYPPRNTAFGAGLLPAGRYRLRANTRDAAAGPLDLSIGRDGASLRRLPWDRPEGAASATVEFDLAAPVRLVTVRGEPEATAAVSGVVIQPVQVRRRDDRLGHEDVEHLAVNGPYFVFLLSNAQYVERDGMWIGPSVAVPMIVARDREPSTGPLRVFLRNGPFENDIVLSGTASQSTTLAPNEERVVTLDVTWVDGAARISVRASRGFRPFQVDPVATDRRLLGVWVAFP